MDTLQKRPSSNEINAVKNGTAQFLNPEDWERINDGCEQYEESETTVRAEGACLVFKNSTDRKIRFAFTQALIPPKATKGASFTLAGSVIKGTGSIVIEDYPLPLNGETYIPATAEKSLGVFFECSAFSEIKLEKVELIWRDKPVDMVSECSDEPRVLIVTPDYPTEANLYMAAFAHSRNRKYQQAGIDFQVAVIRPDEQIRSLYQIDGISVFVGRPLHLRKLIQRKQYQVIIVHFVDLMHYRLFDSYITDERLIFICHGPETILPILWNVARAYFTAPITNPPINPEMAEAIRTYAQKDNVEWVFVSQWLLEKSEEISETSFKNHHVIPNVIDENLFPFRKKDASSRKNILTIRRFENNQNHSIDIAIETILALSRKPFFNDLSFTIVGDGSMFETLTKPIADFPNVHLRRSFIPNHQISEIHANHGILLAPSRHDTQGVSSCEAASSGLVVAGSDVTCCGYFFDNESNHTLANPEDPDELAGIIERLYFNPDEFLAISERMSQRIRNLCNVSQTVDREIALIENALAETSKHWGMKPEIAGIDEPILTVIVPAYNMGGHLKRCLDSLLRQRNADKLEIIVIDDGSTDNTLEIARTFEMSAPSVVRVISKKNAGYGSAVNIGIQEARGKYTRIVDSDDWVVPDNIAALIDRLENEEAELVITLGKHEFTYEADPTPIMNYPMLREDRLYHFDDLTYPLYGFHTYGPILSTSTYSTNKLRESDFRLSENSQFVDMEYNAFAIQNIDTVRFYDLDVYRFLIGRPGQSSSLVGWKTGHEQYRQVLFNILERVLMQEGFSSRKKDYVVNHVIAPGFNNMLVIYDTLGLWSEIPSFLDKLAQYPNVLNRCEEYVTANYPDTLPILKYYSVNLDNGGARKIKLCGLQEEPQRADDTNEAKPTKKNQRSKPKAAIRSLAQKVRRSFTR